MLVVAAALIDGHGRCLMQQRPHGKRHGGLWEFPGGKVEPGEHPADALVRELAEELAIEVAVAALEPVGFATDMPVTMLLYRCTAWHGAPLALAAEALRWDVPEALAALPMPPVDVPLLAALARSLRGG
ncbi:(deoxy)nucleoside triphosphate pyrophosphohydrolase [Sphingomonas phyllosphaerae]|uniref:(deoxy)nucleoside triphosphate pyrophosphohydrolase n=1 Tax=Sphingomonas phyllosphaerae TaxID=257003 RepID=UPI0003B383DA|nr:(deoxy)nucleoside triphosphate pyrophosphohydrolase [Sphingomonas phyllosphaerae]